ncbi:MAG TPA: rhodanese-like domain-containing protein [Thermoleophilaceae bacterium]
MASLPETQHDLAPAQVEELVREGKLELIDVRETYEHDAGHIAGDRHIEMDGLPAAVSSLDPERAPVFYCRTGSRSAAATEAFRASGLEAYNMDGGIVAWVEAGLPIEPDDGRVADH